MSCSEGWYCSGGSTQPMPTNPTEGGKCYPGTFCPGQSEAPSNCTEGHYCATERLAAPTAVCNQGNILTLLIPPINVSNNGEIEMLC